ncbi:MAG: rRNA pseudouridine synthase [Clostridia bacterium]|nr:rRNA pseudouridine synthase [Clostridia bacterium]
MEEIRINKFIASSGVCSRRNADVIILKGRVKVNGQVIAELGTKVTAKDIVEVDGNRISSETNKIYIMLNKPRGYVTTSKEQFNRPSVLDLLDVQQRVFAVGRLDMDSEGLLLLTNDGDFANKIIHPTKHIAKTYELILKKEIFSEDIEKLKQGVDIGGYITRPAIVKKVNDKNIIITIYEGKNRQVRKMCEAVGNRVVNLKRIAIGNLKLDDLQVGKYILLDENKIKRIFEKHKAV